MTRAGAKPPAARVCSHMARTSPILPLLLAHEPLVETYGPVEPDRPPVEVVQTFGPIEAEYAAIRKGCVLIDQPQRGTLVLEGADRLPFLNRMVTQELKTLEPWRSVGSFWLSRKGRIDADLRVIALPDRILLDVDVHAADRTVAGLSAYVIADDVTIKDASADWHRLALHGPQSSALLGATAQGWRDLGEGEALPITIAGVSVIAERRDSAGAPGIELFMPTASARAVFDALMRAPKPPKPAGWAAWNIARIEAGTPVYHLDFGPDALPAETGVLDQRVSFKKGCYLGQEIVARMHALGHPAKVLVGLRVDVPPEFNAGRVGADDPSQDAPLPEPPPQPVSGAGVWADGAAEGAPPLGRVTSSTISPMLGNRVVCFAVVKWGSHTPGTRLLTEADGRRLGAVVADGLRFV